MATVPFSKTVTRHRLGTLVYRDTQNGLKLSPKKGPLPTLPYSRSFEMVTWTVRENTTITSAIGGARSGSAVLSDDAYPGLVAGLHGRTSNKARERFKQRISPSAALGVAGAEARESLDLIIKRVNTLRDAFLAARKGNVKKLRKVLGVSRDRRVNVVRARSHQGADLWLEYWFAIAPLIGDVKSAVETLYSDPPTQRVQASATGNLPFKSFTTRTVGGKTFNDTEDSGSVQVRVKHFGGVRVTNPNLFLAQQLGLVNPAAVAWELVPFSFIVDWFVDVGTFLESWTDFVGLAFENGGTLVYRKCSRTYTNRNYDPFPKIMAVYTDVFQTWDVNRGGLDLQYRFQGFTLPGNLSTTRAATSISLLVKLFTKSR